MIRIIVEGHLKSSRAKSWCHENIGRDWWTDEATQIMLHVHNNGVGECGVWSWQVGKDLTTEFQFKHEQDAVLFALMWA